MDDMRTMSVEQLRELGGCLVLPAAFEELARRLAAAEAIVEKLPKTADGKVPSPPCELWEVKRMGGMYVERHTCLGWVYDPKYRTFVVCPNMQEIPVSNLHSTREAAEAARTEGRA